MVSGDDAAPAGAMLVAAGGLFPELIDGHLVAFEHGPRSVGATVADLPGCVAVGASEAEARSLVREAIALHEVGLDESAVA